MKTIHKEGDLSLWALWVGTVGALWLLVGVVVGAPTTNEILPEGSPAYTNLLQQQRTWSNGSSVLQGRSNGTLIIGGGGGGQNETASCSYQLNPCDDAVRDKQLRLQSIQDYVLSTLGRGKAPVTPPVGSSLQQPQTPQATPFSGEIKTFYASCDIPSRVDDGVWTDSSYFHLFFKFPQPSRNNNTSTSSNASETSSFSLPKKPFTTISAKLRIFKLGQTADNLKKLESRNEMRSASPLDQVVTVRPVTVVSLFPSGEPVPVVEEKIRVSVYWYKAPVTKTHYKKKLLDTKMISVKESNWVEFDIINAAIPWLDRNDKNFGLVVEVENEDNDPLNPADYFANLPCPRNISNSSSTILQLTPAPQLEVCILNTPHTQRQVETTEPPIPFPLQMSQSFNLLSRMAKAHEQRGNNNNNNGSEWQNDDLPPSSPTTKSQSKPSHKHRHGHGLSKNKKHQRPHLDGAATPTTFQLDEDHPLRRILATVATNVHSRETFSNSRQRTHNTDLSTSEDSSEGDQDIIIQKIYIRGGNSGDSEQQQDR